MLRFFKATFFSFACILALVACSGSQNSQCDSRPSVSVSLPVMGYFVNRLAGDAVVVNVMIPAQADHDSYTPRPSQMADVARSTAYLAFGPLEFEATWKERLVSNAPNIRWLDMSAGVQLISDSLSHSADPHYWTSPLQAMTLVDNLADALKSIIPDASGRIDSARLILSAEVVQRDIALRKASGAVFLLYHPALSYVARDYDMSQVAMVPEGVQPTAVSMAAALRRASEAHVSVVFLQPGYDAQATREKAISLGVPAVSISPEGPDWLAFADSLCSALSK